MTDAEASQVERFAHAWAAVADGTPLDVVVAALADDAELVALVRVAASASSLLPATVGAATRARQLSALQSVGRTNRRRRLPRWVAARPQLALRLAAVAVAVALGLGSSVVASADDLPGDPLYGVKRAAETARMALTFDPSRRAAIHLRLAELRIAEIRALINRGRNPSAWVVEALIDQLTSAANEASAARDGTLVAQVRSARAAAALSLDELADRLPSDAADVLQHGAAALAPPPPVERPAGNAAPPGSRAQPLPTVRTAAATPTASLSNGGAGQPVPGATGPVSTARAPSVAVPTASTPSAHADEAPRPGDPPGTGGQATPPPGTGGSDPTRAPLPQATEPPPPAVAPTEVNPYREERATALSTRPPQPTTGPPEGRKRP